MERNCLKLKKSKQRIRRFYGSRDGLVCENITALCYANGCLYAGTLEGLFFLRDNSFQQVAGIPSVCCLLATDDRLLVASESTVYTLKNNKIVARQSFPEPVVSLCADGAKNLRLLTTTAHYIHKNNDFVLVNRTENTIETACACGMDGLYAAGGDALMILHGKRPMWSNILRGRSRMPDTRLQCLAADDCGCLWCGCSDGLYVFDGKSEWVSPREVSLFPACEITSIVLGGDGTRYIGTAVGLYVQTATGNSFLGADRWLPASRVTALAVDADGNGFWVGTEKGLSRVVLREMSLCEKAEWYEAEVQKYHVREGFVLGRNLTKEGDSASGSVAITDNDGLWTSLYVAAEAFRYAVTGDREALENARRSQKAMLKLEQITGIPGFTARAYRRPGEEGFGNGHEEWHQATDALGELEWRGETSSDEMVGHYYAAAWYYDLCADDAEKAELAASIAAITDHMLDNDFMLCDADGLPTTWAHWGPFELNGDDKWIWEKGVNSLEILAFLLVTYHMTNDKKYYDAYRELIEKHHYAMNTMTYKIHDNHACHIDDKLGFYSVHLLLRYETDPAVRKYYELGMHCHYENQRIERNPTWNIIYGAMTGEFCDLENAMLTLRQFPLDLISYRTQNSIRPDVVKDDGACAFGGELQAKEGLPADERIIDHLGYNAFQLDGGNNKHRTEPSTWLLPYWMARYYKMIEE